MCGQWIIHSSDKPANFSSFRICDIILSFALTSHCSPRLMSPRPQSLLINLSLSYLSSLLTIAQHHTTKVNLCIRNLQWIFLLTSSQKLKGKVHLIGRQFSMSLSIFFFFFMSYISFCSGLFWKGFCITALEDSSSACLGGKGRFIT